jgi:hypothetical protein
LNLQALESSCHEAFDVEREAHLLTISPALPTGGSIGDVWSAMQQAGMLDKHLQYVAGEGYTWAGNSWAVYDRRCLA